MGRTGQTFALFSLAFFLDDEEISGSVPIRRNERFELHAVKITLAFSTLGRLIGPIEKAQNECLFINKKGTFIERP